MWNKFRDAIGFCCWRHFIGRVGIPALNGLMVIICAIAAYHTTLVPFVCLTLNLVLNATQLGATIVRARFPNYYRWLAIAKKMEQAGVPEFASIQVVHEREAPEKPVVHRR